MSEHPPVVVLDWDYETFSILDEHGDMLYIYDAPDVDDLIVEGWLTPGLSIEQTLYKRVEPYKYKKATS